MKAKNKRKLESLKDQQLEEMEDNERLELLLRSMARKDYELRDDIYEAAPRSHYTSPPIYNLIEKLRFFVLAGVMGQVIELESKQKMLFEFYKPQLNQDNQVIEAQDGEEIELPQSIMEVVDNRERDIIFNSFFAGCEHEAVDILEVDPPDEKKIKNELEGLGGMEGGVHIIKSVIVKESQNVYAGMKATFDAALDVLEEQGFEDPQLILDSFGINPEDMLGNSEYRALTIAQDYRESYQHLLERLKEKGKDDLHKIRKEIQEPAQVKSAEDIMERKKQVYEKYKETVKDFLSEMASREEVSPPEAA